MASILLPKHWAWSPFSTKACRPNLVSDRETASAFSTLTGPSPDVKATHGAARETEWWVEMTTLMEGAQWLYLTLGNMCSTHGAAEIVMWELSVHIIEPDQTFQYLKISWAAIGVARQEKPGGWPESLESKNPKSTCLMTRPNTAKWFLSSGIRDVNDGRWELKAGLYWWHLRCWCPLYCFQILSWPQLFWLNFVCGLVAFPNNHARRPIFGLSRERAWMHIKFPAVLEKEVMAYVEPPLMNWNDREEWQHVAEA